MERSSYIKGPRTFGDARPQPTPNVRLAPERWFNLPSWQRSLFPASSSFDAAAGAWLLLADGEGFADRLADKLRQAGQDVICLRPDVDRPEQFDELFARLDREDRPIGRIVHCTTLCRSSDERFGTSISLPHGATSLLQIARAVSRRKKSQPLSLLVITNRLQDISGFERPCPNKAVLPVFCRCMAQELTNARCVIVDLPPPLEAQPLAVQYGRYADRLLAEIETGKEPTVAYRQDWRLVQTYSAVEIGADGPVLRDMVRGGLYVITGGLGYIALELAQRLARECQAKLLLIARGTFPERSRWRSIADSSSDATASIARKLLQMEAAGSEVVVATADVSNAGALTQVLDKAEARFGPVRGVFHLAADFSHGSHQRRMADMDDADLTTQMRPKSGALLALIEALGARRIDFGIAFSSTSAVLAGVGYGAYAAANAVMDSMICSRSDPRLDPWMSLNWDKWPRPDIVPDAYALEFEEGLDALWRACRFSSVPQLVISAMPLQPRVDTWVRVRRPVQAERSAPASELAAKSTDEKILPRSALERQIAAIWQELLGIEAVGVTESFLDLGGDSLIGIRVISRIKEAFRVNLKP
ncbi:MAG: KR domain-containing protein, partial [Steroidobacteraceae bacterium]